MAAKLGLHGAVHDTHLKVAGVSFIACLLPIYPFTRVVAGVNAGDAGDAPARARALFTASLNTTLSNSGTIWPFPNDPKEPPFCEDGQAEFDDAALAKAASSFCLLPPPLFSMLVFSSWHLAAEPEPLIKMWLASALAPPPKRLSSHL